MPINHFPSAFTCGKCDYRSEHLLTVCPACGHRDDEEPRQIPASHLTPTGMYLAPVDPVAVKRSNIRVLLVLRSLCLVLGITAFFLLIPFWLLPTAMGPDAYGYYSLPKGRSQRAPSKVTGAAINYGSLTIILISAALFGGYFYLKRKQEEKQAEFDADGHDNSENLS